MVTYSAFSSTAPKLLDTKPKTFRSLSKTEKKQLNYLFSKSSYQHVSHILYKSAEAFPTKGRIVFAQCPSTTKKMLLKKIFRSICSYRHVDWSFDDFAEIDKWRKSPKNFVNPETDPMKKQKAILTIPPKNFPSISKNDDERRKNVEKKQIFLKKGLWTRRRQFRQPRSNLSTQSRNLFLKKSETEKKKVQMNSLSSKYP